MKNNRHSQTRRNLSRIATIVAFPVVLLVGVGIGTSSAGSEPERIAETVEVEKRVEVPVEVEKLVEVKTPVTPDACLAALKYADKAHGLTGDAFTVVADTLKAASKFDVSGMNASAEDLAALQPGLQAAMDDYRAEAASCRAN